MDASVAFRENLLRLMGEQKLRAAELSKRAGLNPRAVKDIEENRVVSPKLSTVIALAEALGADPAEMMGLGARGAVKPELARFLSQYTEDEQGRILAALAAFPSPKP
jgi:transcriptional regulator with XRE-family HTH domain